MKAYPSISKDIQNVDIIAFDKYDGSNIRAEWNKKKGFYKFGSRTRLVGADEKPLGESISLIQEKYGSSVDKRFKDQKIESAICFFEFYGENSSFGSHKEERHEVTLIDVSVFKKGFLPPKEFLKLFEDIDCAKVLYEGKADAEFISSVRDGLLDGMGPEGVVCKGPLDRKTGLPLMFKVKRQDWYDRLKMHCGQDEKLFQILS